MNPIDTPTPPLTSSTATTRQTYKAFISYSHSDNREQGRKWADWLHHSLETYEVPTELIGKPNQYGQAIPAQIYPIFQDEKELSASNDLNTSLQNALNQSEFLIYLSSPRSAQSVYVQEEIKHFKKIGRSDKIIALIVAGEPEYGDTQTDNQCFPDALRYDVDSEGNILYDHHAEALAADVRIPDTGEQGFTSSEGYRRHLQQLNIPSQDIKPLVDAYQERLNLAKLKIISTILGVPLRELTKRDKAYQLERAQRKTRIVQRIAAAIGGLAIIAAGTGVYAWQQKNEAQQNFAQSLFTSGINKLAQNEYGDPAAYIAAAVRSGSKNATEFAESMLVIRDDMALLPNFRKSSTQYSPDGRFVAGIAEMGADIYVLQLYDAYTRQKIADVFTFTKSHPADPIFDGIGNVYFIHDDQLYRYSPDSKTSKVIYTAPLITANEPTILMNAVPSVSATATASATASSPTTKMTVSKTSANRRQSFVIAHVSANGHWIALKPSDGGNNVVLVNTQNPNIQTTIKLPPKTYRDVQFSADSRLAWVMGTSSDNDKNHTFGQVISLTTPQPTLLTQVELPTSVLDLVIAPDNATIYLYGSKRFNQLLDIKTGTLTQLDNDKINSHDIWFNPDGRTLVGFDTFGFSVFDRATGKLLSQQEFDNQKFKDIFAIRVSNFEDYSPDFSQKLVEMNKQVYLKNDIGNPLVTNQFQFNTQYKTISSSTDGKTLVLFGKDQRLDKVDVESGRLTRNFITLPKADRIVHSIKPNVVVIRTDDNVLHNFDINTGKQLGANIPTAGRYVQFNKDHSQLATRMSDENFVGFWQISDGKLLKKFKLPSVDSTFRLDDNFNYIGITDDKSWQVMSIDDNKMHVSGNDKIINGAFSLDGKWFAMGSQNNVIRVFNLQTGKEAFTIPSISAPLMQFSPDSKTLVASVQNGRMRLWKMDTGKPFGQMIPVSPDTQLLHFSDDSTKLFIQDIIDSRITPAVKIIDVKTGNLISLPFAEDSYLSVKLVNDNRQLVTTHRDSDGYTATIWQMPTGFDIPPEDLANDLENFYRRKYDPDTGAIISIKPEKNYKTWFFQDIYTRPIGPTSKATIPEVIERQLPVKDVTTAGLLATNYFYHPLARAGLAEYFSRKAQTGGISQRLIAITEQQLKRMKAEDSGNASLMDKTQQLLNKAKQQIDHQIRQLVTPAAKSAATPTASGVR